MEHPNRYVSRIRCSRLIGLSIPSVGSVSVPYRSYGADERRSAVPIMAACGIAAVAAFAVIVYPTGTFHATAVKGTNTAVLRIAVDFLERYCRHFRFFTVATD